MLKISDNATHCMVTEILTKILTGKRKKYKNIHHWMDAGAARYGWRHRKVGIRHNILIAPLVVSILTKDPVAGAISAIHIVQDNISTNIKRSISRMKRKHRKR